MKTSTANKIILGVFVFLLIGLGVYNSYSQNIITENTLTEYIVGVPAISPTYLSHFVCGSSCSLNKYNYDKDLIYDFSIPNPDNDTISVALDYFLGGMAGSSHTYIVSIRNPTTGSFTEVARRDIVFTSDTTDVITYDLNNANYTDINPIIISSGYGENDKYCADNYYGDSYINCFSTQGQVITYTNTYGVSRVAMSVTENRFVIGNEFIGEDNSVYLKVTIRLNGENSIYAVNSDVDITLNPIIRGKVYLEKTEIIEIPLIYYRFENNICNEISLFLENVTANDYLNETECLSNVIIIPPVSSGGGSPREEEIIIEELNETILEPVTEKAFIDNINWDNLSEYLTTKNIVVASTLLLMIIGNVVYFTTRKKTKKSKKRRR